MKYLPKTILLAVICIVSFTEVQGQKRHDKEQINFLFNQAVQEYNQKKYTSSLENFTKMLEITDRYYIDSVAVYYCGLAAMKAKQHDKAIEHFNRCITIGYNTEKSYHNIADIRKKTESDESYLQTLREGLEVIPESPILLGYIVDYYIESKEPIKATSYIDRLITLTPENAKLYFTRAALFAEEGKIEESNRNYQQAIELDPKYFDAYFSLGANYFNEGVTYYEMVDTASEEAAQEDYIDTYISSMKNAMSYLEKAYTIKPNNEDLLEALQDVYLLMQTEEEVYKTCYEEITKKLNGVSNNFIITETYLSE